MATQLAQPQSWEGIKFGPRRLAHGNFFVRDVEASLDFYQRVCGLTLVFREPGIQAVFLSNGNSHHDVALMGVSAEARVGRDGQVQVPRGRGTLPGLNHLGFEMATEAASWSRRTGGRSPPACRCTGPLTTRSRTACTCSTRRATTSRCTPMPPGTGAASTVPSGMSCSPASGDPDAAPPTEEPLYDPDPDYVRVEEAVLHPIRTSRATFAVRDLPQAVRFYTGVVGLRGAQRRSGERVRRPRRRAGRPGHRADRGGRGHHPRPASLRAPAGRGRAGGRAGNGSPPRESARNLRSIPRAKKSIVLTDPDGTRLEFFVPGADPLPGALAEGAAWAYAV